MSLRVFFLNGWRNVGTAINTKVRVYKGGAWKNVVRMRIYKGGAWKVFHSLVAPPPSPPPPGPPPPPPPSPITTLSVTIDPSEVSGIVREATGPVVTSAATATASGGTPPYEFFWELASWDSVAIPVANTPAADDTTFTLSNCDYENAQNNATFICRVKDAVDAVRTAEVYVTFYCTTLPDRFSLL